MFFVIFYGEEYKAGELALKENDFLELYGKHIFDFVRSGHWKIMTLEVSCRLGLQKSVVDDDTHDKIPNNNLKLMSMWLSNGMHGEEKGAYYATCSGSNEKIKTDLYALQWNG